MLRLLFILTFLFILTSCSDNKDCCVIIEPVEDTRINLWSGEDTLLSVPGDLNAYTVSSDKEEVARVMNPIKIVLWWRLKTPLSL